MAEDDASRRYGAINPNPLTCASLHCCKCDDLILSVLYGTVRGDKHLLLSTEHWRDCEWVGDQPLHRQGPGGLKQIAPAPDCLPFKCLPAEMCKTVPSTLLAKHDVEKIKTIRPLNTSLNPLQENRQPRNSEGRRKGRRDEPRADRPEVYAHMEKVKQLLFFIKRSTMIMLCSIATF